MIFGSLRVEIDFELCIYRGGLTSEFSGPNAGIVRFVLCEVTIKR